MHVCVCACVLVDERLTHKYTEKHTLAHSLGSHTPLVHVCSERGPFYFRTLFLGTPDKSMRSNLLGNPWSRARHSENTSQMFTLRFIQD